MVEVRVATWFAMRRFGTDLLVGCRYEVVFDNTPLGGVGARRVRFGANGHPHTGSVLGCGECICSHWTHSVRPREARAAYL